MTLFKITLSIFYDVVYKTLVPLFLKESKIKVTTNKNVLIKLTFLLEKCLLIKDFLGNRFWSQRRSPVFLLAFT